MSAYIFDTETASINEPRIIEAAWLKISDPQSLSVEGSYLQRFNPGRKSDLGALATHHIMDDDLIDCPAHTTFSLPADTEYLIGHNVDFDWKAVGEPKVKRICTLALSRYLFPDLDSHSQSAMLYHFLGAEARPLLKNAHSAIQDVENCHVILQRLFMLFEPVELLSWDSVWELSERARIPTVMPFGKHKGMAIKDIPSDYKQWLLRQPDVDPYLAKALRNEVA